MLNSLHNLQFYNAEFSPQLTFLQRWILYTIYISTITWPWTKADHSRQGPTVYSVFYEDDIIHTQIHDAFFPIWVDLF
jgi:hypothetical protein